MGVHYRKEIKHTLLYPMSPIINNIDQTVLNDSKYFKLLCKKKASVLAYLLIHIQAERDYFEKRGALIVGSLEKTGIILAVIALALATSRLSNPEYEWVDTIIYSAPVLYLMGIISQAMIHKLDRMILIIEFAIQTINDKNKETSQS